MTVRVVLEFENDNHAKEFVKQTVDVDVLLREGYSGPISNLPCKVIAVFKKPTQFCNPSDGHRGGRKTYMGWTRGKKYGWFVCTLCGKPTEKWAIGTHWFSTLGTNLLPAKFFPEARPAQGWESPVAWTAEELGLENNDG